MKKSKGAKPEKKSPKGVGTNFTNPDVCGTNPLTKQFEPTDAVAIRQRKQMAGIG